MAVWKHCLPASASSFSQWKADNADTIKRRFATFQNQSLPVVEHLEADQKCVHRIDALQSVDDVFAATCKIVDEVLA